MNCNRCYQNPCACNTVPAPYYEDSCFQENQSQGVQVIHQYSPVLRISTEWAVPEASNIVTLKVAALADMLIGGYIWNPDYGSYSIEEYDPEGQSIKVKIVSGNDTVVGTIIPICTKFLITSSIAPEVLVDLQEEIDALETQVTELAESIEEDSLGVSIKVFGAIGDGVNNDCDPFREAIKNSRSLLVPQGTYLIEPTADSGDYMLYLGTANGNSSRNGMTIQGAGSDSIIKLGDNVGRAKLLFGSGATDSLLNMTFKNLTIDLNGANNLQTSYADPLRYNNAFYFFSKCENMLFENVTIKNGSGSQWIRIGDDTAPNVGKNIRFVNCKFENFGIGIPGNLQQDVSVIYVQADDVEVDSCKFTNFDFTFDLARGQTGIELHGKNNSKITNNTFEYVQAPILIVSAETPCLNTLISNNTFYQCNYILSFDPDTNGNAQSRCIIDSNIFVSTKTQSPLILVGLTGEDAVVRDEILFTNNTLNCAGNTNQRTHVFKIEDGYLKSLVIENNDVKSINGCLVYFAGAVMDAECKIRICNNHLDSLGAISGATFPTIPSFICIQPGTGTLASLIVDNNSVFNTESKDYSALGVWNRTGSFTHLEITNTKNHINFSYPIIVGALVSVAWRLEGPYFYTAGVTWNPVSIADGAMTSQTFTLAGVGLGSIVKSSFSLAVPAGAIWSEQVTAANTVTITLFNKTGGVLDLGEGYIHIIGWNV